MLAMLHDQLHCPGGECPLRRDCVRYRARVYGRQDFFGSPPFDRAAQSCAHHMPLGALIPSAATIRTSAYHRWQAAGSPEGRAEEFWLDAERSLREQALRDIAPESERP
jgi:Protein of unknown function (DUF2934)